jgi:hypothetical protein
MAELQIKITKRKDGSVISRFERADGTATWQRKEGAQAFFFAVHDLTHYAVETVLGYKRGFYGLVAEGWNLEDFGSPWPRGPLPADAEPAELIAGMLDMERANFAVWSAEEFNQQTALYYAEHKLSNPPVLSESQLHQIREAARELRVRWTSITDGETLELSFAY